MKPAIVLAALVLFLGASAAFGQKVTVDVDATANFSNYKTFGWAEGMVARNPLISQQIGTAVENELTARGLTKSNNPDLKVAVVAAAGMDIQAVGGNLEQCKLCRLGWLHQSCRANERDYRNAPG